MSQDREIRATDQLHELSRSQARELLNAFLRAEAETFRELEIASIDLDDSQGSVVKALRYIAREIEAGRLSEEQHGIWFARLGYYFGEALRRANSKLQWGLGDSEYAFSNHPVISGFVGGEEAPIITICRNIVTSVAEHFSPDSRIENGVRNWFEKAAV
ncbi:MAG TPA: hypothetical protein VNK51_22890 [Bradyrhizobium sp.]|nr:hypothetical protein [Bradyrhizobium sp.]